MQKLNEAKQSIEEKDKLYQGALALLVESTNVDTEPETATPQMLFISEQSMNKVASYLPKNIEWSTKWLDSASKLADSDITSVLGAFDKAVILIGTQDLIKGTPKLFNKLKTAAQNLQGIIPLAIVQVPPTLVEGKTLDLDVYNYSIGALQLENTQIICMSEKITHTPKQHMLNYDGYTLTENGGKLMAELIAQKITIPAPKPTAPQTTNDCECKGDLMNEKVSIFTEVPPAAIGAVIGKNGVIVKKITEDMSVVITVGKFTENKKSGAYKDSDKAVSGALITGMLKNAYSAKRKIDELVEEKENKKPRI